MKITLKTTGIACSFALAIGLVQATSPLLASLRTAASETDAVSQSHLVSRAHPVTTSVATENKAITTIEASSLEPEILAGEVLIKFRKPKDADNLMRQSKTARGFLRSENSSNLTSLFDRF